MPRFTAPQNVSRLIFATKLRILHHEEMILRVWFSGKTTAFQAVVGGSIPLTRTANMKRPPFGAAFLLLLCGVKKHAGSMFREESKPD
jgi:hypothetical protein